MPQGKPVERRRPPPPPPPQQQQQQQKQPSEAEEEVTPTSTLWVGNLAAGTTDADLMAAFAAHGALDCVAMQAGSRSYAFVMFRSVDTARAAMDALLL